MSVCMCLYYFVYICMYVCTTQEVERYKLTSQVRNLYCREELVWGTSIVSPKNYNPPSWVWNLYRWTLTYKCMYICVYVCIYVYLYLYVCTYVCMYLCVLWSNIYNPRSEGVPVIINWVIYIIINPRSYCLIVIFLF